MFILLRKISAFLLAAAILIAPTAVKADEIDVSGMPTDVAYLQQQTMEQMHYRPFELSEEEVDLLCRLVFAESGNQSDKCQMAVTNVILNRLESNYSGATTLSEVVYEPGQFTPALNGSLKKVKASERVIQNVKAALEQEVTIPKDVMYFNSVGFFSWADKYDQIDDMYFSKW